MLIPEGIDEVLSKDKLIIKKLKDLSPTISFAREMRNRFVDAKKYLLRNSAYFKI